MINRVKNRQRYRSMYFDIRYCTKKTSHSKTNSEKYTVYIPNEISLHAPIARKETLQVVKNIYELIKNKNNKIILNFINADIISAVGMIYIYAEIKNILNTHSDIQIKCKQVKNNKVRQVLKQIGIYSLCNQHCQVERTSPDVIKWRVCSGVQCIQKEFDEVIDENQFKQLPPESDLFGACVEATMNVHRHAYIKNNRKFPVKKELEAWWCFSQVKDGELTVVVCDLGVSIPKTIPFLKKDLFDTIKDAGKITDADIIRGAILAPTSRSKLDYRGNGLPKIAEIAREHSGKLAIHSRKGSVFFDADKEPTVANFKTSLNGTIVAWTLPIGEPK